MSDPTDEQQIEYWSERARHAEAEIERLRAAAKYCEDNHCDVDEIERLRAEMAVYHELEPPEKMRVKAKEVQGE